MIRSISVKQSYEKRQHIGESVAEMLSALPQDTSPRILGIVPRMLTCFSTSPERYEVTEVDVLIEENL